MLKRFKQMLKSHDWFYSFSDDTSVWKSGEKHQKEMLQLGKDIVANNVASSSEVAALYNEAKPENFNVKFPDFFATGGKVAEEVEKPVFVEEGSEEAKAAHKVVYVKQKLNFHDHLLSVLGEIESSIDNPKNNEKFQAALETARDGLLGVRAFY